MEAPDLCIDCNALVRQRQQGIQCELCLRWQHRTCNTGISQQHYRAAVRGTMVLQWSCGPCTNNNVIGK